MKILRKYVRVPDTVHGDVLAQISALKQGEKDIMQLVEEYSVEDLKIYMENEQIITIELGRDYDASILLDELLDLSAEGLDYNVYKINSFEKKY